MGCSSSETVPAFFCAEKIATKQMTVSFYIVYRTMYEDSGTEQGGKNEETDITDNGCADADDNRNCGTGRKHCLKPHCTNHRQLRNAAVRDGQRYPEGRRGAFPGRKLVQDGGSDLPAGRIP